MSQKTDGMIKLALVFFVSLLSFSIGTYVGKKYSDNQYKLSMLEPQKDSAPKGAHSNEFAAEGAAAEGEKSAGEDVAHGDDQKPAALTDSEVAKIAEEFATEDEPAEGKAVANIEPESHDVKIIPNTLKKAVDHVKATSPVAEERIPASIPAKKEVTAAPASLHFTVQIGSYPSADEAEKMTKALQNKGYKTTYVPAQINGQTWYRVNVGLFGSIKEAQDYKKEFLEKTKLSSAIVQRVQQ